MLIEFQKYRDANLACLKHLYRDTIMAEATNMDYDVTENELMLLAEQNFYTDFRGFFYNRGTLFVWEENNVYVSALRIERYCDGVLVTWFQTDPLFRGKGYGTKLLISTIQKLICDSPINVYSHIHRDNHASVTVHRKCGFKKISDSARLLDGSVLPNMITYCYQ